MKTKFFMVVSCFLLVQLTSATAQISTNVYGGTNGASFSFSIGNNSGLTQPTFNRNNSCCTTTQFNSCCTGKHHHHTCNPNANCCGQKHGNKKYKKHDHDCDDDNWKKSKCCKKHDD